MKKHNFYAGPSILNQGVIKNAADAVMNFAGTGLSVLEVSHRGKEFTAVIEEAAQLFKELLDIPEGYEVIFLGGGASLQFYMVPLNLMHKKAAYINTGTWATNAIKQAGYVSKVFGGEVEVLASSEDKNFTYIPKNFVIPEDVDYFHYTSNNTIYGSEIRKDFDCKARLVCDMSSDIFSRPVDISKYDLIYGGAQKNLAPAGVTLVIIREDLITEKYRAVFIKKIGGKLNSGIPHDGRAPDYDDWQLNGDIIVYYPLLDIALELSSMGVRVDENRLKEKPQIEN